MKVCWQKLLLKVIFWLAIEIYFNSLGVDTIADYSEFISNQKSSYLATNSLSLLITFKKL
jgi:hypothetical protein